MDKHQITLPIPTTSAGSRIGIFITDPIDARSQTAIGLNIVVEFPDETRKFTAIDLSADEARELAFHLFQFADRLEATNGRE